MTAPQQCFGFEFPALISIYERNDDTFKDYERQAPGYGYSCSYFIPDAYSRTMTMYIYDRGQDDIPAGIENDIARTEFKRSTFEAFSNPALYDDVVMTEDGVCGYDVCPKFLFAAATFTDLDRFEPRASIVAITTWRGKFIKVRITRSPSGDAVKNMTQVIDEWSEYLWAIGD